MQQVWNAFEPTPPPPGARSFLTNQGLFAGFPPTPAPRQAWDHLGYSYVLENTRAVQIMKRVVRAYRTGETLGVPRAETLRWLDASEALLFASPNPFSGWLTTSPSTGDGETERRGLYWRLFGLDLAFGSEDNRPFAFEKAEAANTSFVSLFEELLFELWQAIANLHNWSGVNNTDDDRIFRLSEAIQYILVARRQGIRQGSVMAREELAAATVLGWIDVTLSANTPVVLDAGAEATNAATRLANLGAKVGIPAHSKSAALFAMAGDLSTLMRVIESGVVKSPSYAYILYDEAPPSIGVASRRVITEWAAATGRDLKTRGKPIETAPRRLVAVK
jgi:hypothetical protein